MNSTFFLFFYIQEFLKTEYSHENIYFWTACERYKRIADSEDRKRVAKQIFDRHLCIGAPEPVNVDSQARQIAQDNLHDPDELLFSAVSVLRLNIVTYFVNLKIK